MRGLAWHQACHARPLHGSQAQMLMLLELLLELLQELLLLLLYVLIHVLTRVPSCNVRKRMDVQEGPA